MKKIRRLRSFKELKLWVRTLFLAIVLVFIIHNFVFIISYIPSTSMVHTLEVGDRLFCISTHLLNDLNRQDIVVFDHKLEGNEKLLIKRIIGMPGDKIRIDKGVVYVNGEKLEEDYLGSMNNYTGSFAVPEHSYFLLGDNRADSFDGSRWKNPFVSEHDIKYKALFRVYPFNRAGNIYNKR